MTNDDFYASLPDNRKFKDVERIIDEGSKIKGGGMASEGRRSGVPKADSGEKSEFNGLAAVLSFLIPSYCQMLCS